MPPGNAKFLMDSVFGLALRMNQFGLSDAEIGLFCAVVIITAGKRSIVNSYINLAILYCSRVSNDNVASNYFHL